MALQHRPYEADTEAEIDLTDDGLASLEEALAPSFDEASTVLSMEIQLNSLYAERNQLQSALGVSDAAEVIALVSDLRAASDRVAAMNRPPSPDRLPDPLEERVAGARRALAAVVAVQQRCEAETRRVDSELIRLEAERVELETNLARVALDRAEMEQSRIDLKEERRQVEHRMSAVEALMEQLDQVLGAQS